MICTVSTVKDSPENVAAFVERNLVSGVDRMFIFLDAPDAAVEGYLQRHPHVTGVVTDRSYWGGAPPTNLNVRQVANANLVNCLLAPFDWADWLFHIDGDECLEIDRDRLLGLGPEVRCVQLEPREAVSRAHPEGPVTYFKRLLDRDSLALLAALGVIKKPTNRRYFRGHVVGKAGHRPALDLAASIHNAKLRDGEVPDHHRADFLRMLHFESYSGEEFVRKWRAYAATRQTANFRDDKERVRAAVQAVLLNDSLSEEARHRYLWRLYERNFEEDLDTLLELGLVAGPDADLHRYAPAATTQEQQGYIDRLLELLLDADKRYFRPRLLEYDPTDLMWAIADGLGRRDRGLRDRIRAVVATAA